MIIQKFKINENYKLFIKGLFVLFHFYFLFFCSTTQTPPLEENSFSINKSTFEIIIEPYGDFKPSNSAIILIDIWQEEFLDDLIQYRLNTFISKMKDLGFIIIFAPSQEPEHQNLKQISDAKFFDWDIMDTFLEDHGITNLFYAGYDTFHCILDKPNGIMNFKSRNKNRNYNYFLIEDLCISKTAEMKKIAIEILFRNNVPTVKTIDFYDYFQIEVEENDYKIEYPESIALEYEDTPLSNSNPLVMLYKKNPNDFIDIEMLLTINRINFMTVIDDRLLYNGQDIITTSAFIQLLKEKNISDLVYGGYYVDDKILYGTFGIMSVYMKGRYYNIQVPEYYVLNELFFVKPRTDDKELHVKATIINRYRQTKLITLNTLLYNSYLNMRKGIIR